MTRIALLFVTALTLAACDQSYGGYSSRDATDTNYDTTY